MVRRFAAALLVTLAFVVCWYALEAQPVPPLALQIGANQIALVQNGAVAINGGGGPSGSLTLPAKSTAGTALIVFVASASGGSPLISSFPAGWVKLFGQTETTQTDMECWVYLNNPGGIQAITFNGTSTIWWGHMSEWSNVLAASAVDASGGASATSGTTLAVPTTTSLTGGRDLAISGWFQRVAAAGAITFTTPAGFTRLADDAAGVTFQEHIDLEYSLSPSPGIPLGPTLTSTATTTSAVGITIAFLGGNPIIDQTAYIKYGSVALKQNTADFALLLGGHIQLEDGSGNIQLEDGSGSLLLDLLPPSLGDPVTIANPTWNGRVVSVTQTDITTMLTNYQEVAVTATNQTAAPVTTPPGNLSDALSLAGGHILLEDGSGGIQLEDGSGVLLLENTVFSYSGLSVKRTQNIDGTVTTYGTVTVYEAGFAAGQTITITSRNLGLVASSYLITNVTDTFFGAASTSGAYVIEFGDPYLSLQLAGAGVLTKQGSQASIQQGVQMGAGVLGYAQVTANQTGISTTTDLAGLTVTVTVSSGRRIRITGVGRLNQNTGTAQTVFAIQEGATVINLATIEAGASWTEAPVAMAIVQPTAGVHTYKLTLATGANTVDLLASATNPAWIMVEDIGT